MWLTVFSSPFFNNRNNWLKSKAFPIDEIQSKPSPPSYFDFLTSFIDTRKTLPERTQRNFPILLFNLINERLGHRKNCCYIKYPCQSKHIDDIYSLKNRVEGSRRPWNKRLVKFVKPTIPILFGHRLKGVHNVDSEYFQLQNSSYIIERPIISILSGPKSYYFALRGSW